MINTTEIKNRINCVMYAQQINLPIRKSGDRCVSPLRPGAKNLTSFLVHDDYFFDFGDTTSGDVIDFCALYEFGGDKGKAIKKLAQIAGVNNTTDCTNWTNYTANLNNEIQSYHEKLTTEDREYLHNRGITDETINRLKIGRTTNGRLCIPYWKNGYISYYATRHLTGGAFPNSKYMKMKTDDYNENIPWGLHTLNRDADRKLLVIAEGAFDVMSFEQENYCCLSAITGRFSKNQLPSVLATAKTFKSVFLIYDNDKISKAGDKFTISMAKILTENRIPFIVGKTPPQYHDVSEYYAAGNSLDLLIKSAVDGTEFLGSVITDQKEFEAFARRVCRYMTKPNTELFFKNITRSSEFDEDWLKTLCGDCKKPPNDKLIADDVIARHKLLYNEKISFFEYNGKYWEQRTDTHIGKYIDDELGIYTTGPKINSILKIIKSNTTTDKLFNVSHVVNFINGTLELSPNIKFRSHSPDDLMTYCLDYPYNPSAHSKLWEKFLTDITDGDDKKISLLQELSGYVLYPDNQLQKCAVLIGGGANGKSVFLNTLTKIFGSSNISNVEMSALSQPFQAINLMSSMMNISAETKTNVTGAESVFKQVVAGDEISACYKGKDYIKFRPRAKMFIACNEYMKSSDTTEGWTRRFCFVDFPIKFTETPNGPNEKLIDREIESKLLKTEQLTAIFNWVLSGYQQLLATNYFTEPDDQKEINEEFKEISNPLIIFIKEFEFQPTDCGKVSNDTLYQRYKIWCADCNHNALSKTSFSKRVPKLMLEYHKDIQRYVTSNERGYKKFDENLHI